LATDLAEELAERIPIREGEIRLPVPEGGNLLNVSGFAIQGNRLNVQSWDTAMKADQMNDFIVCTTWIEYKGDHYLPDVAWKRCEYPALLRLVLEQYHRHTPGTTLTEDKGSGTARDPGARHRHQIASIDIRPEADKKTRFSIASLSFEQGSVYLPKEAPSLGEVLKELTDRRSDQQPRGPVCGSALRWDPGMKPLQQCGLC
jgi:phage terminase large subunit-like protein